MLIYYRGFLAWNVAIFSLKKVVPFRSVPDLSEMELVSFQFLKIWNEFRNESFRRFVTNKSGI